MRLRFWEKAVTAATPQAAQPEDVDLHGRVLQLAERWERKIERWESPASSVVYETTLVRRLIKDLRAEIGERGGEPQRPARKTLNEGA